MISFSIKCKNIIQLGIAVCCIAMLFSCGGVGSSSSNDMYVFVDDYDREVLVPKDPKRIVSASPAITEILFALDAQDKLVGRTDYCNYPAEALNIESIGGINNLNVEKLLSLSPDLVLVGSMVSENIVNIISKAHVPVVVVKEKDNFDALFDNIERIGVLSNKVDMALKLNDSLNEQVSSVKKSINVADSKPTVYYVVGYGSGGNFTAGGNTFINDIFNICGLKNIAEDIKGWNFSTEALLDADPDYIFIRKEDKDEFMSTAPYTYLSAVKKKKVIPIESAYIDLQVPRNVEGLLYIHNSINNEEK